MNRCPSCQQTYTNADARFCPHCGKALPPVGAQANPHVTIPMPRAVPTRHIPIVAAQPPSTTHRLGGASQPRLSALPVGELINAGHQRYQVLDLLEERPDQCNLYRVQEYQERRCPQCQKAVVGNSQRCERCGTPLPAAVRFRLQEALQEGVLAAKIAISEQRLYHPGLVNIYRHFVTPWFDNQQRHYVLLDDIPNTLQERTLARLGGSQPLPKLLQWGRAIAEALTYLHSKQMRLPHLDADQILILDDDQVKLRKLDTLVAIPPPDAKRLIAEETRQLALLLQHQLHGRSIPAALVTALKAATAPNQTLFDKPQQLIEGLWGHQTAVSQTSSPQNIKLLIGSHSDVGRQRQINEDSMLTVDLARVHNSVNQPLGLYVVADGMGGHEGGDLASKLAVTTLDDTLRPKLTVSPPGAVEPDYKTLLAQACQTAAKAVYDQARQLRKDMGTTLVAALVVGNRLYAANIGDSRLYKINRATIHRITEDHSMVERLVKHQMLSPEEARHHPQANLIYRSLGDRPNVEADLFQEELQVGDSLLLCSDGLSGQVAEAQIQSLVLAHPPQEACQQLVQAANAAGGPDNSTVIIVRVAAIENGGA